MKNSYLVSLIGVAAMCFGSDCFAAAFGDSAIVGATYVVSCVGPNPNAGSVLISIPFSVSASSRLFGTGTITTHDKYFATVYVQVTSGPTQTVLGTTASATGLAAPPQGAAATIPIQIIAQSVVHNTATPLDPSAPSLVLAPGDYQVHLLVAPNCGSVVPGYSFPVDSGALSFVLLSAYFDRIYADGFS